MSDRFMTVDLQSRKQFVKEVVQELGYALVNENERSVFFEGANKIVYGVNLSTLDDGYVAINFAVAAGRTVDDAQRIAVLNHFNYDYRVLKCFYSEKPSLLFSMESFVFSEEGFVNFFNYSAGALEEAYAELQARFPGAY
ncbi:MAG: hypothetical protein ACQZ2J_29315 [Pseudomonas piscis]|uniref:hypothetical protein n=1 Tax=Pseudomonas piscis TaxID=2614538 RepID=UPI003D27D3D5